MKNFIVALAVILTTSTLEAQITAYDVNITDVSFGGKVFSVFGTITLDPSEDQVTSSNMKLQYDFGTPVPLELEPWSYNQLSHIDFVEVGDSLYFNVSNQGYEYVSWGVPKELTFFDLFSSPIEDGGMYLEYYDGQNFSDSWEDTSPGPNGFFFGTRVSAGDLWIESVEIAQAVFDPDINSDGVTDLVFSKPTTARVKIGSNYNWTNDSTPVRIELKLGGTVVASDNVPLRDLTPDGFTTYLNFAPTVSGELPLVVQVDAADLVVETNENNNNATNNVSIKRTVEFDIIYSRVKGENGTYETPSGNDALDLVANGNEFLVATYPIAPDEFSGVVGNDYTGSLISGNLGLLDDLIGLSLSAFASNKNRAIGIVSDDYFPYHGRLGNVGIANSYLNGVLVTEGYWTTVAHEIGHTFSLDHECNSSQGYWVDRQREIVNSTCFMGAGTHQNLNTRWVDHADFLQLFNEVERVNDDNGSDVGSDSVDAVFITGILDETGKFELRDWLAVGGRATQVPQPGEFTIRFTDLDGTVISDVPFSASFELISSNSSVCAAGPYDGHCCCGDDIEVAPIALAVEYPRSAVGVEVSYKDQVVLSTDIGSTLLEDAVNNLSSDCITHPNEEKFREFLRERVAKFKNLIETGNIEDATKLVNTDVIPFVDRWLDDKCIPTDPLLLSKRRFKEQAGLVLQRLGN